MSPVDQAIWGLVGVGILAAVIFIPYLHIQSRKLDEQMKKRPPAE